jgi:predicted ATP-binding protein involved in virulence
MSTALRLDRLSLHNFRCFADCSLDLHQDLTAFVAENGRGKTALLDGIGVALGTFVDAVSGTRQFHGFERADVRLVRSEAGDMTPALPTRFEADGYVAGQQVHWSRSLQKYSLRARSSTKDAKSVIDLAVSMREGLEHSELHNPESEVQLPLVAFYGTGRLWSEHRLTEGKKKYAIDSRSRLSGYAEETLRVFNLNPNWGRLRNMRKGAVSFYVSRVDRYTDLTPVELQQLFSDELAQALASPFYTAIRHVLTEP